VKKLCTTLRRGAKEDRVLFHYNGHGVPRPTASGEIWVFNKNFTQYIPLSILGLLFLYENKTFDLVFNSTKTEMQGWLGSPSIYVFDASASGAIVNWFIQFAQQREKDHEVCLSFLSSFPQYNNNYFRHIITEGIGYQPSERTNSIVEGLYPSCVLCR